MKFLVLTLLITAYSSAQEKPDDLAVLNYVRETAAAFNSDVQFNETSTVAAYEGKYTGFPRKESLVLFPVKTGLFESVIPILYYYKQESWHVCCSENYTFISGAEVKNVEVIDFDNDGTSEVLFTVYSRIRGLESTKYILVSYEFGRKRKLFETMGFDASKAEEGLEQLGIIQNENRAELKEGDKLKVDVQLTFDDVNNDGINEIIQSDAITVIIEKDENGDVLTTRNFKEKKTYYYYDKKFKLNPPPPTKER